MKKDGYIIKTRLYKVFLTVAVAVMMILTVVLLLVSLTACRAGGTEDTAVVLTAEEEALQEAVSDTAYVESNELKYEENTKVTSKGTLCAGEASDDPDIIDVDWELTDIVIEDAEAGTQTVTIEQSVYGYFWTDGDVLKTSLNVPAARLCDIYTGRMISAGEDAKSTEIEWKDNTYTVSAAETALWEDGNWDTDWVEDSEGGRRLASTLKVKTVVTIEKDYDGLALVLTPVVDANGSADGEYIMDVWTDGSYLFHVADLSSVFSEMRDEETKAAETGAPEEENSQEEMKTAHTHNYTGVVTVQPTCTVSGQKVYTCSCGDTYTENLGTTAHDFSVPVIQMVHHDEVWKKEAREVDDKENIIIHCPCGEDFTSNEDYTNHCLATIEEKTQGGTYPEGVYSACGHNYWCEWPVKIVYEDVKVSDAYDAEEIVGYKCSVCGRQN